VSRPLDAAEREDCLSAIARTCGWGAQKPTDRERTNAEHLVSVISQLRETWSGGPAPRIWARSFATRNPDTLLEAIKRLTETSASCPSVAAVTAVMRQIDREHAAAGREVDPDCEVCENTGWMPAPDEQMGTQRIVTRGKPAHQVWDEASGSYIPVPATPDVVTEVPNVYSAMRPCRCPRGRVVERSDAWRNRKRNDSPALAAAQEQF
jgi:hypothetical protein